MIHEIHSGVPLPSFMSWLLFLLTCMFLHVWLGAGLSDDGIALLAFKKAIKSDPLNVLSNWNGNDSYPCSWTGVTCSLQRVTSLNITGGSIGSCDDGIANRESWKNARMQQSNLAGSACLQNGSLSSYTVPCRLEGSLAAEIGDLTELRALILPFNGLTGEIPKEIGNLHHLQVLDLQQNAFSGVIPLELGNLSRLQVLNLEKNSLEGQIAQTLADCYNLLVISLGWNKLSGAIPSALGNLPRLQHLALSSNQLNNQIPPELQHSCDTLEHLDLANNFFTRSIPSWLGDCSKLKLLLLRSNYFRGGIPPELGRLSMLQVLDVSMNGLTGQIPASLGNCVQLSFLVLTNPHGCVAPYNCTPAYGFRNADKPEFNQFSGPLPSSVAVLPKLRVFWAPRANLSGVVPDAWGACEDLRSLNLAENAFTGNFPRGLGNCQSLVYLDLSSNQLHGRLPMQLSTSCMMVFNVSKNKLSGEIPARTDTKCNGIWGFTQDSVSEDLISPMICPKPSSAILDNVHCGNWKSGSCSDLGVPVAHDLSSNNFTGSVIAPLIGEVLMQERPVYVFSLSDNQLSGNISPSFFSFCQRFRAFSVNLSNNLISGELPGQDIGGCRSLVEFTASRNRITGTLPSEVGNSKNLTVLDLSQNQLTGNIPSELGGLQMLQRLVLANNAFIGRIPKNLGQASSLHLVDLSGNAIIGEIPSALGNLTQLEYLLLNNNNLSGRIPEELTHLNSLVAVNLAFNNLSGSIPEKGSWVGLCNNDSFRGNQFLQSCAVSTPAPAYMEQIRQPVPAPEGSSPRRQQHGLSTIVIVAITSGCAITVVLFVLGLLVQCTRQRIPSPPGTRAGRKEVVTFTSINFHLTYENVVRATGNFSVDYLIGNGGFGATYKAELMPGVVVAVKRLAVGRFQGVQQFDTEIRTLGRIRHPNLVTLIGYHASEAEMFLIYNYFPRGNLESFIHNRARGEITWQVVHKIALGIAEALLYLHDECVPRVLHRDIKPSNILLDSNLNGFLADFGLARLLGASETHATTDVAGTFGYVAPEYAMTCRVSDKADVYSYGVVLLELLSGKRALDPAFSDYGHGFNIVGWACLLIGQGRAHEVFIVELWELGPESYLLETLKLAVMCTVDSLTIRPTMRQVVDRLKHIQSSLPFL